MKTKLERIHLRIWLAVSGLSALIIAGCVIFSPSKQPVYQNRTLDSWLEDFDRNPSKTGQQSYNASQAVRGIGTNAIPHLLRMLKAEDSSLKLSLVKAAKGQSIVPIRFTPANIKIHRALVGVTALGRQATETYPILTNLASRNPEMANEAVPALSSLGERALPFLTDLFTATTPIVRSSILARAPLNGEAAVPLFLKGLNDEDADVRGVAAYNLRYIKKRADLTVPALIQCLADPVPDVRKYAAWSLGEYGARAESSVQYLEEMRGDDSTDVRSAVEDALQKIRSHQP
jgi:HEAT repeat protein